MVDHFDSQVIVKHKIAGEARAMVVTRSFARCIEYYQAISGYLRERKSPYKAIVAFSHSRATKSARSDGEVATSSKRASIGVRQATR